MTTTNSMASKLIVASVAAVATALAASSSPVGALQMRAGASGMRRAASVSKRVAPRVSAAAPRAMRIKRATGVPSMEQPQLRGSGGRALEIARKNTRATFDQPEQQHQQQQWRRDADDVDSTVEHQDPEASAGSDEVAQFSYMWVPDLPPKPQDQDQHDKGTSGENKKKKSDVGLDINEMLRSMLLQDSGAKADGNRGAAIAAGAAAVAGAALTAAALDQRDQMNHAAAGSVPRSQIAFDNTIFDTYDSFSSYRGHGDAFRNLLYPHEKPSPANAELYPHVQQRSSWEQLIRSDAGRVPDLDEILREQCEDDDEDVIDDSYC